MNDSKRKLQGNDHSDRNISTINNSNNTYIDPPVDFNPSLYPTKKRRVVSNYCSSTSTSFASYHSNETNRNMSRRKNRNSNQFNTNSINAMFDDISDEDDPNIASSDGICKLAEKLGIDPFEDLSILVLLDKLGAHEKPAQISREEWVQGCQKLQTDSIEKLKELLPSLDLGFMVDTEFRSFYKFAFQFNREGTHKTLPKDLVIGLIEMALKGRITADRLETFVEFLKQTNDPSYNTITLDQWMSFYDFSKECPDLKDYDEETSAWPVLIDDYVDYATNMQM